MTPGRRSKGASIIQRDDAAMKVFVGKHRCYIGVCMNTPKQIITYFGQRVWVCDDDVQWDEAKK